jgi:hypothetical protein
MNAILRTDVPSPTPTPTTERTYTRRGQVTSYGDDRICSTPDCPTRLSRYNKGSRCCIHDRPRDD